MISNNGVGLIVLVGGKAYSGKSTVSDLIVSRVCMAMEREEVLRKRQLAYRLKKMLCEYHGITIATLELNKKAFRSEMQLLGTEAIRDTVSQDFWSRGLVNRMKKEDHLYFLVDDVRFQDEIEVLTSQAANTVGVWINADEEVRADRNNNSMSTDQLLHPSEVSLTGQENCWDFIINNSAYDVRSPEFSKLLDPVVEEIVRLVYLIQAIQITPPAVSEIK